MTSVCSTALYHYSFPPSWWVLAFPVFPTACHSMSKNHLVSQKEAIWQKTNHRPSPWTFPSIFDLVLVTVVTSFHPSKFFGKCFKGLKSFSRQSNFQKQKQNFFFFLSNFHILIISWFIKDDEKLKCESFDRKNTAGVSCRIIYHVHLLQQSNKMPVGKNKRHQCCSEIRTCVVSISPNSCSL